MALIEVYHVVATNLPVDATDTTDIPQGLLVGLNSSGQVVPCDGDTLHCVGLAGDSRSTGTTSFTPESGSPLSRNPKASLTGALVIGALGAQQRFSQNRVADNFNEVLASGKMTVYHGGGEFWTDQYEIIDSGGNNILSYEPGFQVHPSGAGETSSFEEGWIVRSGRFTLEAATTSAFVGLVLSSPTAYPSGVPGTETGFSSLPEGGNSLSWGTFLHIKLSI